ncbi:MAG: methyltransferase domain-containing protein [Magnetococcales bacterium]|nr:methyltransferase domain-containing protein [Magnetococcales bacterium]
MVATSPSMNRALLDYIRCPRNGSRLVLANQDGEPVVDGELLSTEGGHRYPVRFGVPILLADPTEEEQFTGVNFAEQWGLFDQVGGLGEEFEEKQTAEYLHPIEMQAFSGQLVFEAGCGYGRNLLMAQKSGAALTIGMDVGEAAFIAKRRGVDALIGDILNPPVDRERFDVVFTFGVLQHVSDPHLGFQKLFQLLKPGGLYSHSVYSLENNWFLVNLFTPAREKIFRHLPVWAKVTLSMMLAVPTWLFFWLFYAPFSFSEGLNGWASKRLFYYDFAMLFVKKLGFKTWVAQLFDHFNAPLVTYFSREQLEGWCDELALLERYYYFRNQNTWNFGGVKPKLGVD